LVPSGVRRVAAFEIFYEGLPYQVDAGHGLSGAKRIPINKTVKACDEFRR
jgi:hypothetical protein